MFDIDKLFLSTIFYKKHDTKDQSGNILSRSVNTSWKEGTEQYYANKLIFDQIALLKDSKSFDNLETRSMNYGDASIDSDTKLLTDIVDDLEITSDESVDPYDTYSLWRNTQIRDLFITGKFGIGPFALNNNNHILTMLYGVKFKRAPGSILNITGHESLCGHDDMYGESILSWLSGLINAHVDVAKDPYISKLNVNKYTYNLVNLMVRTGFSKMTFYFTTLPIMKELALRVNNAASAYGSNGSKSKYRRQADAENDFILEFANSWLAKLENTDKFNTVFDALEAFENSRLKKLGTSRSDLFESIFSNKSDLLRLIAKSGKNYNDSYAKFTVETKHGTVELTMQDVQMLVYDAKLEFDQYSEALSQLVKYCKIDTKKLGKNISELRDFMRGYNKLFNNPKSRIRKMFDNKSLQNLKYGSYIDTKTSLAISLFEDILSAQLIDATPEFNRQCDFVSRYLPAEEDGDVSKDVMKKISDAILVKIRSGFFNKYAERHGIDIKGLVNGNNTIYDRLNKLKIDISTKEEYEDLRDGEGNIYNYLLNTLTNGFIHELIETQDEKDGIVAKPQKDTYDNVKFLSTMTFMDDDSVDADEMSESWEELLEDTDHPELQLFARDLIVYAFITNGGNGGSNNIYKYIPTSWLVNPDNTGYSNSFAYHIANELDAYRSGEMIFDKKDADEVILNNWTDNLFIPTVKISDGFLVYYTGRASIDIINGVQVRPQTDIPLLMRCNINTEMSSFVKIQRAHDKESQRSVAIYKKIGIVGDIATYVLVDPKGQNFGNKNKIYEYGRNDSTENEVSRQLGFNESLTMLAQQLGADITDVRDVINKLIQFVLSSTNREGSIELIKKYGVKDVLFDTVMDMVDNRSVKDLTELTGGVSEALEELKNLNDNDRTYKVPEEISESTSTDNLNAGTEGSNVASLIVQQPQSKEIANLYEENSVIETTDGIKIPIAIGVTIQFDNSIGGNRFKIESIDDGRDDQVYTKTYNYDGTYSHISAWSYEAISGFNNVRVFAPSGEEITNIYRIPEGQKVVEVHNNLINDLGGGEQATTEVQDAVKVAKKGMSFEEVLAGQEAFFSKEEQAQIKQGLNGKNLQVMSVSRLTDPAFFSKEIVSFLEKNAKKPLNDPTRVMAVEIWSKHDGLPIKDILDACKKYRVAPMVSFSITGLGGTALEGGVMRYLDMLKKVGELVNNGTLNPTTTTVRIDPILPGVTNMDDIKQIVNTAKSYGIKKFVTSLVQSYGYTEGTTRDRKVISGINNALATEGKTYDWDKYYGRDSRGKINFKPKQEVIEEIGKVLVELDKDPEITIQTCAFGIKGLRVSACLDPMIIERITGVDILRKDGTYDRDTSRPECMCYGCHGDFFRGQNKKCYSSCAYCYAAHSGDNKLNYYNEDGTLKDNDYTRTYKVPETEQQKKINIYAGTGENADLSNFAIRPFRHQFGSTGAYKDFQSVEQAFQYIKAHQFADTRANDGIARNGKSIETEIMETTSGAELRKLGRSVKELNVQAWDRAASAVMKGLLKESFEQNPQALQRLLSTGNATLTHTQDKGKWGTEFPKLLMEVREELRGQQPVLQTNEEENRLLEMQDIKDKAIADGTFMKAPNGNPTNLNERQWLQVRTKAFKNWFGDWENDPKNASKVVDENGEPLVVYHGTTSDFTTFSKEKLGTFTGARSAKLAFFAASNEELAKDIYAKMESNEHFYQRMLKFDPNFTREDLGIGPEEPSITDRVYDDWAEYYRDLEFEYKDVLQELEKHRTTHKRTFNETISKADEWVTELGLEDYIKLGYTISDSQRKEYENGKAITISKEIDVFDNLNKIEAAKALNTKRSREFARKYDALDKGLKEALEKAEKEDKNSYRNRVKALFMNIKNPKVDSDYGEHYRAETYAKRIQDAINNGNDGGIIKDTRDPYMTNVYYFFEPNQVKSATGNNGMFSTENDDIFDQLRALGQELINKCER